MLNKRKKARGVDYIHSQANLLVRESAFTIYLVLTASLRPKKGTSSGPRAMFKQLPRYRIRVLVKQIWTHILVSYYQVRDSILKVTGGVVRSRANDTRTRTSRP